MRMRFHAWAVTRGKGEQSCVCCIRIFFRTGTLAHRNHQGALCPSVHCRHGRGYYARETEAVGKAPRRTQRRPQWSRPIGGYRYFTSARHTIQRDPIICTPLASTYPWSALHSASPRASWPRPWHAPSRPSVKATARWAARRPVASRLRTAHRQAPRPRKGALVRALAARATGCALFGGSSRPRELPK